jgi:hypothetical protein
MFGSLAPVCLPQIVTALAPTHAASAVPGAEIVTFPVSVSRLPLHLQVLVWQLYSCHLEVAPALVSTMTLGAILFSADCLAPARAPWWRAPRADERLSDSHFSWLAHC